MPQIRLATAADVPAILRLSNEAAATGVANFAIEPEPLAEWERTFAATHERFPWYVAEDGATGAVVGFAKASPWKGRCAYAYAAEVTVYVDPAAHRRGVGRALYDALFATLRAQGYRRLLAGITQPNEASVRLHEAMGMRPCALLERIGWKSGRWHDVGYWQADLGPEDPDAPPQAIRPVRDAVAGPS